MSEPAGSLVRPIDGGYEPPASVDPGRDPGSSSIDLHLTSVVLVIDCAMGTGRSTTSEHVSE